MHKKESQSGQIALLVTLSVLVSSAVVLSVLGRSVVETRLTAVDEGSSKSLRVAESGAEEALRTLSQSNFTGSVNGQDYNVTVIPDTSSTGFVTGRPIISGEAAEVSLADGNAQSVNIYWTDKKDVSQLPASAVQIVVYTADNLTVVRNKKGQVVKTVYGQGDVDYYDIDANQTRTESNLFDYVGSMPTGSGLPTGGLNPAAFKGINFAAYVNIRLTGKEFSLRIKPLYNQATIAVQAVGKIRNNVSYYLPSQQYQAEVTTKGIDNIAKKLEVTRSLPALPEIFDAALYSGVGLGQ